MPVRWNNGNGRLMAQGSPVQGQFIAYPRDRRLQAQCLLRFWPGFWPGL